MQHATNCHCGRILEKIVKMSSHRVDGRPRILLQAKFDSQLVRGFQERDLAGHPSGERAIRCSSRNFDRKSLSSQPSIGNKVFAIAILRFTCTPQQSSLHDTKFLQATLVNGKVASPKRIAGDTTASNNLSRKTKETCLSLFKKILFIFLKFVPSNLPTMGKFRICPGQKIAT